MNSDAFFSIGKPHNVCQDYARSGAVSLNGQERFFALVADGCSSSPHSDVGARLLVSAALQHFQRGNETLNPEWTIQQAAKCARMTDMALTCLDATLMSAFCDGHTIRILVTGDGVVAVRRRDGTVVAWAVDFGGAPAYLSYLLDNARHAFYLDQGLGQRTITETAFSFDDEISLLSSREETRDKYALKCPTEFSWSMLLNADDIETVVLMSDGAQSFKRKRSVGQVDPVPLGDVLKQVMDFKTTKGEFVTRRCRRFLHRFCAEEGWTHDDDFSVAAIHTGEIR